MIFRSGYLVRFAATQHRFMMKMRQWQSTLNRMGHRSNAQRSSNPDVGVDVGFAEINPLHNAGNETIDSSIYTGRRRSSDPKQKGLIIEWIKALCNTSHLEDLIKPGQLINEIDTDYIQYCYGSDAMKLNVTLVKHPEHGLGL